MISLMEIIDMIIMTAFVGYIFSDLFSKFREVDILHYVKKTVTWQNFKFAAMITAPGLILHELGHKFVAISFGMNAVFHAAYPWLIFGLVLKLLNFGFIVFVPAFVRIIGNGTHLQFALISLAGPLTNLIIWQLTNLALKKNKIPDKYLKIAHLTKQINKFLFIFNMIPIPGFDGFQFFRSIFKFLF